MAKSVLVPLGLTAAASGKDAAIQKILFGLGRPTLITSNEKMGDIMKLVRYIMLSGEEVTKAAEGKITAGQYFYAAPSFN